MSTAQVQSLLHRCAEAGIGLAESDGELRVHFSGAAPEAALIAELRAHKPALLQALRAHAREQQSAPQTLPPAARRAVPASPAQRRLWLIDRLDKSSAQYNMVGGYRLRGALDRAALERALAEVVARHEVLRSNYRERDGELLQELRDTPALDWDWSDVSALDAGAREQAAQALLQRENRWRFDLARDALVRVSVQRRAEREWLLLINLHHIVGDGWSIRLLAREIGACYAAALEQRSAGLPAPALQYAEFAEWQRTNAGAPELREQLAYWQRTLDGAPQLHALALDLPRPALQTSNGHGLRRRLPAAQVQALRQQCLQHGVTLFVYLQAVYSALLGLYQHERDIVTGFPVAGRRHRALADTVGLFVNTLVLRSDVDGNAPFQALLQQTRRNVLAALEHQDLPFEALIEALKPARSRAYGPLVQVFFALQNQADAALELPGLTAEPLDDAQAPVKFDLQLLAEESADGLDLIWQCNRDLFLPASLQRLAQSYERLLAAVLAQPAVRLFDIELDDAAPPAAPATSAGVPRLEHLFEAHARAHPQHLAVAHGDERLSYAELNQRADGLAARLRALGVGRGSTAALLLPRCADSLVGMLAILKAGAAYVPLDPAHPPARLAAIVADSGAAVVLTHAALEQTAAGFGTAVLALDTAGSPAQDITCAPQPLSAADPAYVIYTSGTTGTPKGVVVAHAGLVDLLAHFQELTPLQAPWNGSQWCSHSFDAAVYEIFSALCGGGAVHIVPEALRLDPPRLFDWMAAQRIHSSFVHAGYLEPFAEFLHASGRGRDLRRLLVGVEPIPKAQLQAIAAALPQLEILNAYGPTEATICCTLYHFPREGAAGALCVPIGSAVSGAQIHLMNPAGRRVAPGAVGEFCVGGVCLAQGYLNRPQLTAERFVLREIGGVPQRLYRTGDLGRQLPGGAYEFLGRADEQVKIRGFRVEPAEVEARLGQLAGVSDCHVAALGQGSDKYLVAYAVLREDAAAAAADFAASARQALRQFLPDYMLPAHILVLERLPLTVNGKVDRAALPLPQDAAGERARIAPRTPLESQLAAIWQELLGIESVGVDDDFFALGGHSLLATRLTSRLRRQFQLADADLAISDVFEHPTLAAQAEVVAAAQLQDEARRKETYLASLEQDVEEGVF
ncbi:non-ribosomal peptide synthetase [Tahibacter harae]|uniref:Amino acid adenylation domain-containing protein n=1 Tax=Tahibacter harae TaxID=2963937 RepID=A0ABT1QNM9_9GAMM|nr:amino acid adenylation domain-containing protein [Tahibacter harae]MCQ4163608.1 amino acid adenylation domain-containing protein [Tahibacter harae]